MVEVVVKLGSVYCPYNGFTGWAFMVTDRAGIPIYGASACVDHMIDWDKGELIAATRALDMLAKDPAITDVYLYHTCNKDSITSSIPTYLFKVHYRCSEFLFNPEVFTLARDAAETERKDITIYIPKEEELIC